MRLGNRAAGGLHPRHARPDGALLQDLVRLEAVEVSESHAARLDGDGPGCEGRTVEFETSPGADDDPVETRIVAAGTAARPHVGGSDVRAFADRIRAYFAARLNAPGGLILPHLLVGQLERTAILGLQPRGSRTAVAAVAEQSEFIRAQPQAARRLLRLGQVRRPAADEGERVSQSSLDPRIDPRQVAHGRNIAREAATCRMNFTRPLASRN